jgi:hypothetical protein
VVNKYENILNRIYCLSQEACSTITNLRLVPGITKDINSYRLYVLIEKLNEDTFEAFKVDTIIIQENIKKLEHQLYNISLTFMKLFKLEVQTKSINEVGLVTE